MVQPFASLIDRFALYSISHLIFCFLSAYFELFQHMTYVSVYAIDEVKICFHRVHHLTPRLLINKEKCGEVIPVAFLLIFR